MKRFYFKNFRRPTKQAKERRIVSWWWPHSSARTPAQSCVQGAELYYARLAMCLLHKSDKFEWWFLVWILKTKKKEERQRWRSWREKNHVDAREVFCRGDEVVIRSALLMPTWRHCVFPAGGPPGSDSPLASWYWWHWSALGVTSLSWISSWSPFRYKLQRGRRRPHLPFTAPVRLRLCLIPWEPSAKGKPTPSETLEMEERRKFHQHQRPAAGLQRGGRTGRESVPPSIPSLIRTSARCPFVGKKSWRRQQAACEGKKHQK